MKRLSIFILIIMILTTTTSFALDKSARDARQKKSDILIAAQTVADNRNTVQTLTDQLRIKTKESKSLIKSALESKADLTSEQLQMYKQVLQDLKANQEVLKGTLGEINAKQNDLKKAREVKDLDLILRLYNDIISVQNVRIQKITDMNNALDSILNSL